MITSLPKQTAPHLDYADAIRAFATVSIVFLHVASPIVQDFTAYKLSWWWTANIIYSFSRPAIALFVMISGMLLLSPSKEESLAYFFKKRFIRIGIPFIFWGVLFFLWKTHGKGFSMARLAKDFVEGPVYYHLWFIYTITGIYLVTPIFRVYAKNASRSNKLYLLILWFIGTAIYPFVKYFSGISVGIPIMAAGGFLGAFLLGNFVKNEPVPEKYMGPLWIVLVLSTVVTAFGIFFLSRFDKVYNGVFADFLSPNVIIMALCLFFIFKEFDFGIVKSKYPLFFKAIKTISSTSFSVYIIHIPLLEIFKYHLPGWRLDATLVIPLIGIPLTAIITLVICIGFVVVLRKIPLMKFVLP